MRRKQEARNQSPLKGCLLIKAPGVQEAYDFIGTKHGGRDVCVE